MKYIRSLQDLPINGKALIYGSGGRGEKVLQSIQEHRPKLQVAGFLDSHKNGEFNSLPVVPIKEYFSRRNRTVDNDEIIIVASTYYLQIVKRLERHSVNDYFVFLGDDEHIMYANLPVDEVLEHVDRCHSHPKAALSVGKDNVKGPYSWCSKFYSMMLRPTGVTCCCWMPDFADGKEAHASLNRLVSILDRLVSQEDVGNLAFCQHCPERIGSFEPLKHSKINNIDINISILCNLQCRFCAGSNEIDAISYNYIDLLEYALYNEYFEKNFTFTWAGDGEPVLNKSFPSIVECLLSHGASGVIYTNAVMFSEVIEKGLRASLLSVVSCISAGCSSTYANIHGVEKFDAVWLSLSRYVRANASRVYVKYIVTNDNSGHREISSFIDRCVAVGVKRILISKKFLSTGIANDKVASGVSRLVSLAKENGLDIYYSEKQIIKS